MLQYVFLGLLLTGDLVLTGRIGGYSPKFFFAMLFGLFLSGWIQSLVHELGHMIGALAGGFRFVYLSCWPICLTEGEEGKLRFSRTSCKEIQCAMAPRPESDTGCFLYVAGGCVANLLLSIAAGIVCGMNSGIVAVSCLQLTIIGVYKLLVNGTPYVLHGMPTDGYILRQLGGNPFFRRDFNSYLRLYADRLMHRDIRVENYHYKRCATGEKDCLLYYEAIQQLLEECLLDEPENSAGNQQVF